MILVGQVNRSCVIRPQGARPDPPCRGSARRRCAGRAASRSSLLAHPRGSIPSARSLGSAAIRTDGRLPGREVARVLPSSLAHGGGPGRSCPTNLIRARCSCPTARPRVRFAVAARRTPASSRPRRDGGGDSVPGQHSPVDPDPAIKTTPVLAEIAVNVVPPVPLGTTARVESRGVGQADGSTSVPPVHKHLIRTCAPSVQPPMDAPWGVCAVERQYRGRQASGRARSIRETGG